MRSVDNSIQSDMLRFPHGFATKSPSAQLAGNSESFSHRQRDVAYESPMAEGTISFGVSPDKCRRGVFDCVIQKVWGVQ